MSNPAGRLPVSVIVPTYRRTEYLLEALHSALAQTYQDFEVIVSDNAPSSKIEQLVRSLDDPRLRYRHNGGNIGVSQNAVAACRSARGELLAHLHDDDAWEPQFLERLVPPLLEDASLVLAFADHWIMDEQSVVDPILTEQNTRRWKRSGLHGGVHRPFARLALVDRAIPVTAACVVRKSAVDWNEFPAGMEPLYDFWLAYLLARTGAGAYYCPERLTRYRVHRQSLTAERRWYHPAVFCYDNFVADPRMSDIRGALKRVSDRYRVGLALTLLESGDRREARRALRPAVRPRPSWRAIAALALSFLPLSGRLLVGGGRRLRRWAGLASA